MGAKGSIVENYMNNRFEAETMICKNTCIKMGNLFWGIYVNSFLVVQTRQGCGWWLLCTQMGGKYSTAWCQQAVK